MARYEEGSSSDGGSDDGRPNVAFGIDQLQGMVADDDELKHQLQAVEVGAMHDNWQVECRIVPKLVGVGDVGQ